MGQKITLKSFFFFLIIFLVAMSFGFGQNIFDNSITGDDINPEVSNPYINGQYFDPNITVSGIGKGIGAVGSEGGFGTNNRYNLRGWDTETLDPTAYFEFTLEPNPGYKIDFINFEFTSQRSGTGPINMEIRSSLDDFSLLIGEQMLATPETPITHSFDLIGSEFQNIATSITFRVYAWNATSGLGTFSINDFTFNGIVSPLPCASTVTWNGSWNGGTPDSTTEVIIDSDYNTGLEGNFESCKLIVNPHSRLTVANGTFVEVINNVIVNGELRVETQGNFVQSSNYGIFTVNSGGDARVFKETPPKAKWYHYTYWSSPVKGQIIEESFPNTGGNRRFWFNATNYLDEHTVGTTNGIPDNIDDDDNDWQYALGSSIMETGVGYAITEPRLHVPGESGSATFTGIFNTGDIHVPIHKNPLNTFSWNFIGNPYPSAIDFIAFQQANSNIIDGAAYFWSQATPPSAANPGNYALNFSQDDYAVFTIGSGGTAGGNQLKIPDRHIPSCQSFFISGLDNGITIFTNTMRMADGASNNLFFKNSKSKTSLEKNKLWINLTTDNGVFNQILTAYVDGATNGDDGLSYDAPKLLGKNFTATLYSNMESSNKKFAIQGKAENSLDSNEIIKLGFATNINVETTYSLSIGQIQGNFLTNNTIYLKDNLLDTIHNLSDANYTFTSDVGEFNDRFVIMFNKQSLSTDELIANSNTLKIIDLNNGLVQLISSNNLMIEKVSIFDVLGRELYQFKGQNNSETYNLSNLKNNIYIVKVELSNGAVITKKALKK